MIHTATLLLALIAADTDRGLALRIEGAWSYRRLHEIPLQLGGFDAAIGAQLGELRIVVGPGLAFGRTEAGLGALRPRGLILVEYAREIFALGLVWSFDHLIIDRATVAGSFAKTSSSIGLIGEINLWTAGTHAVFISARAAIHHDGGLEVSAGAGWRFLDDS